MWDLEGKNCVITGGTSGIGFETAKRLDQVGANLIFLVRSESRKKQMIEHFPGAIFYIADMGDLLAVYEVSQQIGRDFKQIHLLKNNAGIISYENLTKDLFGIEKTIVTNYLSHFVLTETLLPNLTHNEESRIVSTGSLIHRKAQINFQDIYNEQHYAPLKMYATSKLMLVLYSHHLGKKLEDTNINTHCVDPGIVGTQISRSRGKFFNQLFKVGKLFMTNPVKGSKTNSYGCLSPELSHLSSTYLIKEQVKKAHPIVFEEDLWLQLEDWSYQTLKKVGIDF